MINLFARAYILICIYRAGACVSSVPIHAKRKVVGSAFAFSAKEISCFAHQNNLNCLGKQVVLMGKTTYLDMSLCLFLPFLDG